MSDASTSDQKLSVAAFLKVLTDHGMPVPRAMAAAGKILKKWNTRADLGMLTNSMLAFAGVDDKKDRRMVLEALKKAGIKETAPKRKPVGSSSTSESAGPSSSASVAPPPRKRRRKDEEGNEFLPGKPADELEGASFGSLEFKEIIDEEASSGRFIILLLRTKSTVINRAPIMMAWATVVAERLGFKREEALSIASVYTEMNAVTKGVSIGIYGQSKKSEIPEPSKGGMQPYVELMGRSPLYQTASNAWLGMAANKPTPPSSAYSYITRSLRQTAPHVLGAMRLLAESYEPDELNRKGFGLYCEFRPEVGGWGERGEVKCETILQLRKKKQEDPSGGVKLEEGETDREALSSSTTEAGPPVKQEPEANQIAPKVEVPQAKPLDARASEPPDEFADPEYDAIDFSALEIP
ncbi:hypothetical protein GLOTRDRAFT_91037 [Gloeophyllum trabeum ATCC 11539]|uniref:Uncharacterized protein n=1 Tax=Gloeophyllum trabeum (strain ATCC 11539 / FP-39264 / Madison 617) TaxID=670483 RepID=S7QJ93_GLOTA|nr:uncharacterized protein GLOTRDRAFT_91037 [Gloeophyllum trabeum ATCC 11539]EPQ59442.1 hypothetical protein GLOTRDRAFT_91037 [Gloeophyllum trabeum ATCC 11539]